jgi:Cu(I)/Ag(I) efflux system membrane fusion protein
MKDGSNATAATASSSKTEAGCCASHGAQSPVADSGNESDSDVSAELAKLSPADRTLAEKQKVCPVTDALLGSMGVPSKVTVKGRTVFLCCDGCAEKLNRNADKYLAKLDRGEAKQ